MATVPSPSSRPVGVSPSPVPSTSSGPVSMSPPPVELLTIRVLPWADAVSEPSRHGVDPRSPYVETFWLPIIGPTATFVLRKLAERFDASPQGFVVDQSDLAASIGIGGPGARHAPLRRALQRCARYGLLRPAGPRTIEARRMLVPVPSHRLTKLPAFLQTMHRSWEAGQPGWAPQRG